MIARAKVELLRQALDHVEGELDELDAARGLGVPGRQALGLAVRQVLEARGASSTASSLRDLIAIATLWEQALSNKPSSHNVEEAPRRQRIAHHPPGERPVAEE